MTRRDFILSGAFLSVISRADPFFPMQGQLTWLAWESDSGVTGSPASAWLSKVGTVSLAGASGERPAVTASAFGSTTGLTFDGTNDAMSITAKPIAATAAGSLSLVFKTPAAISAKMVLVSQSDAAVANDWFEVGIDSDGKLYVESNNAGTKHTVKGSTVLTVSTIYNAILVYDGTDFYLLLDNVEENPLVIENIGAFAWFGRVGGTTTFTVGATITSGGAARFFSGVIGGIYFFNSDITA